MARQTMMTKGFFSVPAKDIESLDDKGSVHLLHKLIHAEARRLGLSPSVISVPFDINDPDGGIDAIVTGVSDLKPSEIIFNGNTYYQVKSGKNVSFTEDGLKNVVCKQKEKG